MGNYERLVFFFIAYALMVSAMVAYFIFLGGRTARIEAELERLREDAKGEEARKDSGDGDGSGSGVAT